MRLFSSRKISVVLCVYNVPFAQKQKIINSCVCVLRWCWCGIWSHLSMGNVFWKNKGLVASIHICDYGCLGAFVSVYVWLTLSFCLCMDLCLSQYVCECARAYTSFHPIPVVFSHFLLFYVLRPIHTQTHKTRAYYKDTHILIKSNWSPVYIGWTKTMAKISSNWTTKKHVSVLYERSKRKKKNVKKE